MPSPNRPTASARRLILSCAFLLGVGLGVAEPLLGQASVLYTRPDSLRGANTPERAWWDVTFYDLAVRIDPDNRAIEGSVGIVYRATGPLDEMQIDLQEPMVVDSVIQRGRSLDVRRDGDVFYVTPAPPGEGGEVDTVTVHYHGNPRVAPRAPWDGGFVWATGPDGGPWVANANQGLGASVWWPNKDTQRDEPEAQRIAITVPDPMVNVSNGRLVSVVPNDDGTTTWEWYVNAPINNYTVAVNAGAYTHQAELFHGEEGVLTLDYWPLAVNAELAEEHFAQVPSVLACFESWFGPFPWYEDGFKMVETPYLGMEHQSAIAYGNRYMDGYLGNDLSGTGLGLEWDYIIVHEAAHEWWGNNITTEDIADMWVHESFGTYAEGLYVECLNGSEAGAEYVRGLRSGVENDGPIIGEFGVNAEGSGDMYSKGANMLHTIRQVVGDDARWREILRGLNETFRHQIVTGDEVRSFMSGEAGVDLDPVFRQYLTTADIPVLELRPEGGSVAYRWTDVVDGFEMPIDVATGDGACERIRPTSSWQSMPGAMGPGDVAIDHDYYVFVRRGEDGPLGTPTGVCPG